MGIDLLILLFNDEFFKYGFTFGPSLMNQDFKEIKPIMYASEWGNRFTGITVNVGTVNYMYHKYDESMTPIIAKLDDIRRSVKDKYPNYDKTLRPLRNVKTFNFNG